MLAFHVNLHIQLRVASETIVKDHEGLEAVRKKGGHPVFVKR